MRCIGVSNFDLAELAALLALARHRPCVVQLNSEPLRPALGEQAFCRHRGIQFEGYSTLGGQYGGERTNPVLSSPIVTSIAEAHGRTPAQVALRWALQQGQTVIPRTSKPERMRSNLELFEFDLGDEEMDRLAALGAGPGGGRNER